MFDYAVDFVVNINLGMLTIESARDQNLVPMPTRVRYRGLGFRLDFQSIRTPTSRCSTPAAASSWDWRNPERSWSAARSDRCCAWTR